MEFHSYQIDAVSTKVLCKHDLGLIWSKMQIALNKAYMKKIDMSVESEEIHDDFWSVTIK